MEDFVKKLLLKEQVLSDVNRKEKASLESLLQFDPYEVLPHTTLQQMFAGDKSKQTVPAVFFAGKNPLVSACLCQIVIKQWIC